MNKIRKLADIIKYKRMLENDNQGIKENATEQSIYIKDALDKIEELIDNKINVITKFCEASMDMSNVDPNNIFQKLGKKFYIKLVDYNTNKETRELCELCEIKEELEKINDRLIQFMYIL